MTFVTSRPDADGAEAADRLGRLYARHVSSARRFAYLLCGDDQMAADIAQEAFLQVARRWGTMRDAEAFPAYLRTTVRNLVRMHARASAREQSREGRYLAAQQEREPVPSDGAHRNE